MKPQNFETFLDIKFDIDATVYLPCYNTVNPSASVIGDEWVLDNDINGIPNLPFSISKILYFESVKKDKESKRSFDRAFTMAYPKQEVCAMIYFEDKVKKVYYIVGDADALQKKIESIKEKIRNLKPFSRFDELEKALKEEYKKIKQDI